MFFRSSQDRLAQVRSGQIGFDLLMLDYFTLEQVMSGYFRLGRLDHVRPD
jgi:hypothetical protein